MEIKDQVFKMFSLGDFKKAIAGDEGFFFKDELWGDHNSLGIFFWLFDWLKEQKSKEIIVRKVKQALQSILKEKPLKSVDDLNPLTIIRDYCIAAKERKYWPIEKEFIVEAIREYKENFKDDSMRVKIDRNFREIKDNYLPDL